jgi:hypothetical protein
MDTSTWLDDEIGAMRMLFNNGTFNGLTPRQRGKLHGLFKDYGFESEKRDIRIAMLKIWTGIGMLSSSNQLTFNTAHEMINYLVRGGDGLSWDGAAFLSELEKRAKAHLVSEKGKAGVEDEARVSDVLETYFPWLA